MVRWLLATAAVFGATVASAGAAVDTYKLPIHGCSASYAHRHHEYRATDIFAGYGCRFVAPITGRMDEVSRTDHWSSGTNSGAARGGSSASIVGVDVTLASGFLATAATGVGRAATTSGTRCSTKLSARLATFAHAHHRIIFSVAVRDLTAGTTYGYRRHTRQRTASIVKVEILEALLHKYRHELPSVLSAEATGMIERSDNRDAERLYQLVGGASGLRRFGRVAGLVETAPAAATGPGYAWGLTLTSPSDQLRLLELLTHRNALLTDADRRFALRLMKHVETDQRWGVTSGTGSSRVALKNGWLPLRGWASDWQINSIGAVQGRLQHYLIAVESHGANTMSRGVEMVEQVSRLVSRACS